MDRYHAPGQTPVRNRPLFVANSLAPNVHEKLKEQGIHGKPLRAITGRDLALLIMQRLTDPCFHVELEFRRIFM
ncbi:MAG: hypothetical protein HQL65_10455 [Magnetococcales bacterium]|nr:hypothetical protein [Magnetococcales bacterium]